MKIYFFALKNLKNKLTSISLDESERCAYLILSLVSWAATGGFPTTISATISGVIGVVLGTLYCFKQNGGSSGREFLDRFLSLSWVVGLRVGIPLGAAFPILLMTLVRFSGGDPFEESSLMNFYGTILGLLMLIVIYWRIGFHIRDVRLSKC